MKAFVRIRWASRYPTSSRPTFKLSRGTSARRTRQPGLFLDLAWSLDWRSDAYQGEDAERIMLFAYEIDRSETASQADRVRDGVGME